MTTIVPVPPLNAEEFAHFMAGEMPYKKHEAYLLEIAARSTYVVERLHEIYGLSLYWWDFDNLDHDQEKDGTFDINRYTEQVNYVGELNDKRSENSEWLDRVDDALPVLWSSDASFPVSYLTEDFEEASQARFNALRTQSQALAQNEKQVKQAYNDTQRKALEKIQAFVASLSVEERATLSDKGEASKFVSVDQYQRRLNNLKKKELAAQHKARKAPK